MLQALMEYGARLDSEPGFKTREVRWLVKLDKQGQLQGVLPLGDGKRGQMLPRCPDMHNMNAGRRAHFLIESAQYTAFLFKKDEKPKTVSDSKTRHEYFADMLRKASAEAPLLKGLADAMQDDQKVLAIREALAEKKAKPADYIEWQIGETRPRTDSDVQAWWRTWRENDKNSKSKATKSLQAKKPSKESKDGVSMRCFLTGSLGTPLSRHRPITGLPGANGKINSFGDPVVSFDKAAFCSYGLKASANAAIEVVAAQRYVDGLNDLIRNHSRKLANALVVHWFKDSVPEADDPLDWLEGTQTDAQVEASAQSRARDLLDAIRSGARPDLGQNRYYAMTLSGASGRVMVRDWMEGAFEELVRNVRAWFVDLEIVAAHGMTSARGPKFFELCLALIRNDRSKSINDNLKKLPAAVSATLWKSAIQHLPIPQSVLAMALAQFRSDRFTPDEQNRETFNHARMGLLKAYFVRLQPKGDTVVTAYLNPDHPDPAYHCGRLLAVFANLQRAALGDVGAGVVQRYYAAASQTPGLILGRLAANARNHLGKLEGGLAFWFEGRIADVMSRLGDRAPRILDLEGQGLFALGYYQQLAALRQSAKADGKDLPDTPDTDNSGDQQ
ncbi:MAG: type I-C CRISPR-associated protein Cas8c/Csd1 [Lysobacteraceae bacterium]